MFDIIQRSARRWRIVWIRKGQLKRLFLNFGDRVDAVDFLRSERHLIPLTERIKQQRVLHSVLGSTGSTAGADRSGQCLLDGYRPACLVNVGDRSAPHFLCGGIRNRGQAYDERQDPNSFHWRVSVVTSLILLR
jgi:hypothetical protein